MPRLHTIDPNTESGPGADFLNGPLKGKQFNIFKALANNPGVLKAFLAFSQGVKTSGSLTPAEHEIVALTCAQKRNCEYCLAAHTQIAIGDGVDEELTVRIRRGESDDARQQALIDFANAILETEGLVGDEQLQAFRAAGFDDAAIVEVIGQIAVMTFTNFFTHLNETEVDFPVAATV